MFNKLIERLYFRQVGNLALYDQFTGCLNRNWYERFAQRETGYITVCDVNGLKSTNDTLGHAEGDRLILSVATTLLKNFPQAKVVRYGGDEFYLFTKEDPTLELKRVATKDFSYGTCEIIGNVDTCVKCADSRMYTMKKALKVAR